MAEKKLNSSSGYFNKEMLAILKKGEKKTTSSTKKTVPKSKSIKK